MSTPKETLWPIDGHTLGKHYVLREYLRAWYPIIGRYNRRILFIDGFAGPGEYKGGELGSPAIALDTLAEHQRLSHIGAEFSFVFIESRKDRFEHLKKVVKELEGNLPDKTNVQITRGSFDSELTKILELLDEQKARLAPAFVMIDPFGVSGTPMKVVEGILSNPSCEVFVSFMYEAINRFKATPEFETPLKELFGCEDWKDGIEISDPFKRKEFFYGLYEKQLKKAGAKHVVRFELFEGNRLIYAIFFATGSTKGSDEMKKAIWKVAPFGDFSFRGSKSPDQIMINAKPNTEPLRVQLRSKFRGKGFTDIEYVLDFVKSDQTDYCSTHVKKLTLVPMEKANPPLLEVDEATRSRKNTYPDGTKIQFL